MCKYALFSQAWSQLLCLELVVLLLLIIITEYDHNNWQRGRILFYSRMAGYIGAPAPFDHQMQKWSSYQTQFEHFLKVNDITNDEKKNSCFIALMGSETYEILEGLMFPDKPASSTVTTLFAKLTAHFEPKRLKIAEQYKFWQNKQGASQTLADYISEIRKLASTCQFPQEYLQDALTTAFVLGLKDENISHKLLAEEDLTLDRAIATAQSLQIADKETH